MYIDYSGIFHASSKDLTGNGTVKIPQDTTKWPKEWSTTYYKTYPRVPKVQLLRQGASADLFEILTCRRSRRDFMRTPIDMEKISQLLLYSCGTQNSSKEKYRTHPSGGARFPIEHYLLVFAGSKEIPSGVYHYNISEHSLDVLWERKFTSNDIAKLFVYPWAQDATCALVMTAVFWRNQMKYGERGYRYMLLEAGHIGENVYLVSEGLDMKCCAIGGSVDQRVEDLLNIDGITESVVHSFILG